MATTMANRVAPNQSIGSLCRLSFNFLRNLSSVASSSTQNPAASITSASKNPKILRNKSLFEVAQFLPNCGLGYHMAKIHLSDVSYEITKIKFCKDGRHGKAWGIVYKHGFPAADAPEKIRGVDKRCWRYIPHLWSKPGGTNSEIEETDREYPEAKVA